MALSNGSVVVAGGAKGGLVDALKLDEGLWCPSSPDPLSLKKYVLLLISLLTHRHMSSLMYHNRMNAIPWYIK